MSRNRPRSPRTSDHILIRLTEAVDRIATALAEGRKCDEPAYTGPQLMPARHLGVQHMDSYIEVVPRPVDKAQHENPEIMLLTGVLVGIRPGSPGRGSQPADMTLVIRQGGEQKIHVIRTDAPVKILARSTR